MPFGEDVDLGELDTTESGLDFVFPMTAVEKDGRWYLSAFYTIAEKARAVPVSTTFPRPASSRRVPTHPKAPSTRCSPASANSTSPRSSPA